MPEGHSVHRIARQFQRNFVGNKIHASSPQGRFSSGAETIDGRVLYEVFAVGKQMFLVFGEDLNVRVHLGIYGAWDFAGEILVDATIVSSIGAPRRARLRMSEASKFSEGSLLGSGVFPPDPVGAVRLRIAAERVCADLRGPTSCEILSDAQVDSVLAKLGPDPLRAESGSEERFIASVRARKTPIALLLMDQSVVAGIGNVYRAEILFRAKIDPLTPGKSLEIEIVRALWRDWSGLLRVGLETGQMMTMDGLSPDGYRAALANRDDRHWVYKREGQPCRVCGTSIALAELAARKLYWCPSCQH